MNWHKWKKEIHAWADGAEIEFRFADRVENNDKWVLEEYPDWYDNTWEFRIKPKSEKPKYLHAYLKLENSTIEWSVIYDKVEGYDYIGKVELK